LDREKENKFGSIRQKFGPSGLCWRVTSRKADCDQRLEGASIAASIFLQTAKMQQLSLAAVPIACGLSASSSGINEPWLLRKDFNDL
jgi:hypothetical protein